MAVYTRPRGETRSLPTGQAAADLLFKKWHAWDTFEGENAFKKENSRLDYLQMIAVAAETDPNGYNTWLLRYKTALTALEVEPEILETEYETVWRLIVGWSSNPALETGITLHHLYGFPYIPGSAVKGLVHHVAEMSLADSLSAAVRPNELLNRPPSELFHGQLRQLQLIKRLFGSIHVAKPQNQRSGDPDPPKDVLQKFQGALQQKKERHELSEPWCGILNDIDELLDKHTGGVLRFYDAVPAAGQTELLQTDIVNCHYQEYYQDINSQGEKGSMPPSDDQKPNPVVFLAVKPEVRFIFPFSTGRAGSQERQRYSESVNDWLVQGLSLWGIGAKTAAGYGYLNKAVSQPVIKATPPEAHSSSIKPASKLQGIKRALDPSLWGKLAENNHIARITGGEPSLKPFDMLLPHREILGDGKALRVYNRNDRFYYTVEIKLQGVVNASQAQYIWENVVLPAIAEK